jgi:uncharacterized membrane protein YfcA
VVRSLCAMVGGCAAIAVLVLMANSVVFHGGALEGPPEIPLQVILLAMGALAAVVGGYVAAAIGHRTPRMHGVALGLVLACVGGTMLLRGKTDIWPTPEPRWFTVSMVLAGVAGAMVGGLVKGQAARVHTPPPPE